jgi:hypothetical protein
MRRLHGAGWRERAGAPRGRRARHLAVTAAGAIGLVGVATGRRLTGRAGLALWSAGTAELAWRRVAPGPRNAREISSMIATSAAIPAAATWHWLRAWLRSGRTAAGAGAGDREAPVGSRSFCDPAEPVPRPGRAEGAA